MSWVSKTFKKATKWVGKLVGGLTGADELARIQQQQLEQAQRQAYEQAGAQMQSSQAGTQEALSNILKKRSALQQSIRTGGQQRLGD